MQPLQLEQLAQILINEDLAYKDHCDALNQFLDYCSFITNINADVTFDAFAPDTHLPSGMAINPQSAAMCVTDYRRTLGFIRAINLAIKSKLIDLNNNQTVHLLYAGCGPYATLVLALMAKYQQSNIKFHLLDIHQTALDSAQILLKHLGIPKDNYTLMCADACELIPEQTFDLIVSETMQKALEQEPQVKLTHNLKDYLKVDGVFIPQSINLQLALIHWKQELDISKENKRDLKTTDVSKFNRIKVGQPINFTKTTSAKWFENQSPYYLDFGMFSTGSFDVNLNYDFSILTQIQLFKEITLEEYDSDLTLPTKLHDVTPAKPNKNYHLKYELGSYPRFELTLVD